MRARTALGAFLLAVGLAPAGPPDARAQEAGPGVDFPQARAVVDTTATTVGGRLRVTVDVEMPPGWFVTLPEATIDLGPFRVRSMEETQRTEDHRQLVLTLIATEPGELEIPSIPLRGTHGSDPEAIELATEPIPVSVASNLSAEERAAAPAPGGLPLPGPGGPAIPPGGPGSPGGPGGPGGPGAAPSQGPPPADLKPALEAPRRWLPVILGGAVALLAGIVAFLALRWWRARDLADTETATAPDVPSRPPWEVALEELDAIVEARWVERGLPARQYEEVTWTLRRYLEDRYSIPALESTTADLRGLLRAAPIRADLSARVLSLLDEADLVKFAKGVPDPSGARASEKDAREIVRETTPLREEREEAA